jgi:hypothetical protein
MDLPLVPAADKPFPFGALLIISPLGIRLKCSQLSTLHVPAAVHTSILQSHGLLLPIQPRRLDIVQTRDPRAIRGDVTLVVAPPGKPTRRQPTPISANITTTPPLIVPRKPTSRQPLVEIVPRKPRGDNVAAISLQLKQLRGKCRLICFPGSTARHVVSIAPSREPHSRQRCRACLPGKGGVAPIWRTDLTA